MAQTKPQTHFTRILTEGQVKELQAMLEEVSDRSHPIDFTSDTFKICAPDGDSVFAGLKHPSGKWLCRLHREVFQENS